MSAGFTPGPWALSDKTGNIMRDILGAEGSSVCSVFNVRHHMLKNPQPDTDLILAAPELYAVVEEWLLVGNDLKARKAIREKARSALAKARGES